MASAGEIVRKTLDQDNVTIATSLNNLIDGLRALFDGDIAGLVEGVIGAIPAIAVFFIVYYFMRFVLAVTIMKNNDHQVYARGFAIGIAFASLFQNAVFGFIWKVVSGSFVILLLFVAVVFGMITFISRQNANRLSASADAHNARASKYDALSNKVQSRHGFRDAKRDFRADHPSGWSKFRKGGAQAANNVGRGVGNLFRHIFADDRNYDQEEAQGRTIDQTVTARENQELADERRAEQDTANISRDVTEASSLGEAVAAGNNDAIQRVRTVKQKIAQEESDEETAVQDEVQQTKTEEVAEKQEIKILEKEKRTIKDESRAVDKLIKQIPESEAKQIALKEKEDLRKLLQDIDVEETIVKDMEGVDKKQIRWLQLVQKKMRRLKKEVMKDDFMFIKDDKRTRELYKILEGVRAAQNRLHPEFQQKFQDKAKYNQLNGTMHKLHQEVRLHIQQLDKQVRDNR